MILPSFPFEKLKTLVLSKWKVGVWLLIGVLIVYFSLPRPLFKDTYSTLLVDRNQVLLNATIAKDGQWRFPTSTQLSYQFEQCLLHFEDEYYYQHMGVNPISMVRALYKNVKNNKVTSGGSTITMQTIRLALHSKKRSLLQKLLEIYLALRLECGYSKKEILNMYASHAPFGSNVVGLEAASWRYYGRSPEKLSWAENATLAVLPNSPSLIYPGKNSIKLLRKRNSLLKKLFTKKIIDSTTYRLALLEQLPQAPYPLPNKAPHLYLRAMKDGHQGKKNITSIDGYIQERTATIIERYYKALKANGVHNACAMIVDVKTNKVIAYIGNTKNKDIEHGGYVDIIDAKRSYGSLLKPFLYNLALDNGLITPNMFLNDYPMVFKGYEPQNFHSTYEGVVPASKALSRSLNIPFVKLLQDFGTEKFHYKLKQLGCYSIAKPASHYGLSIILGGGESTMWELCSMYAGMSRTLQNYNAYGSRYCYDDFLTPSYFLFQEEKEKQYHTQGYLSASSIWYTLNALADNNRPDLESNWKQYTSEHKIAWKTGTSFGSRDAWSIGVTADYAIAVWVGNADGEGRPGLQGITTAAPIMFELFGLFDQHRWFEKPQYGFKSATVCQESGMVASSYCSNTITMDLPSNAVKSMACKYHMPINFDRTGMYRVNSDCESVYDMQIKNCFVLPPIVEWYYVKHHANYKMLPPFKEGCANNNNSHNMQFIYPRNHAKVFIPIELDGEKGNVVFELAHRKKEVKVYWHLDNQYIGYTVQLHQLALAPSDGMHVLSVVDELGEHVEIKFETSSTK
jgi:penicillin-binding protein 1C